jgi:hypothetical protein
MLLLNFFTISYLMVRVRSSCVTKTLYPVKPDTFGRHMYIAGAHTHAYAEPFILFEFSLGLGLWRVDNLNNTNLYRSDIRYLAMGCSSFKSHLGGVEFVLIFFFFPIFPCLTRSCLYRLLQYSFFLGRV